jgi:PAS domain S-box-containing protein
MLTSHAIPHSPPFDTLPPSTPALIDRLACWPVAAMWLALAVLLMAEGHTPYEQPILLLGLNFVFVTSISLLIACWAGRSFLEEGWPGVLLLGSGALIWGLSGSVGLIASLLSSGTIRFDANTLVTIHNMGAWFAALSHLAGTVMSCIRIDRVSRPRIWLMAFALGVVLVIGFVTLATLRGWAPLFFQPGHGGTLTRQLMLGSTIAMFLLTAMLLQLMNRQAANLFSRWYSLAVLLLAAGLVGVFFQKVNGSVLCWAGRGAQFLGSVYMLVALLRSAQGCKPATLSLQQAAIGPEQRLLLAVAVAVASTAGAAAVRLFFLQDLRLDISYVTFFPAVTLAAFLGGFLPGLITTLLSILWVCLFWTETAGRMQFGPSDLTESAFFLLSGLLISQVARMTHRFHARAVLAEAEVAQAGERIRTAEALRVSEERLAYVIEGTAAGIWDWNVQTGEVIFNERWAEMVGYTLDELAPLSIRTWTDLAHPDDLRRSEQQLVEVFARRRPLYDLACRMRHRDGGWIWIQDRGKVIEWTEDGNPVRMTGSHIDITARKRAEEQLLALNRELQVILDTVPVGIVKLVNRRMVWSNRGMEEMLRYAQEDLLGQTFRKLHPSQETYDHLRRQTAYPLLAQGGVYDAEHQLVRKDGTSMFVRMTARAVAPGDPLQGCIWTLQDISERKRAEEAVRERVELFQALFEGTQAVQLLVDPLDGTLIDANRAAASYYGIPLHQLTALTFDDINLQPFAELSGAMNTMRDRQVQSFLCRHRLASGELRDVEIFPSPIKIGGWSLLHLLVHDVTERRRLEESLRERELNLGNLVETTSDMIVVATLQGKILFTNQQVERVLGYESDELAALHVLELHPPDLRPEAQEIFAALLRGERDHCPLPLMAKDGGLVPVETRALIGPWNGQECLFGFIRDLSAEEEAKQRFERLFRCNPAPMALSSLPDRIFLDVNDAFESVLGYARGEVLGKTARELGLFPSQIDRVDALAHEVFRMQSFAEVELEVVRKDTAVRHGLFSGGVIHSQGRDYLLTVMSDITERKRIEQELQRSRETAIAADAAKSRLLSTVAHEFRTPLSLLQSSLDILDRYGQRLSEEQRHEQNRYIRNATQQLTTLAETVLTYRTMENKAAASVLTPCDIGELSRTIADETRGAWAKGQTFTIHVGPECGMLLIDPIQFRRVLENLLSNAFQYTPPDRSVTLQVMRDGERLRLTVADQGIGIDEEDADHIFDAFYRGRNVGQRRGMGLGLNIVRETLNHMQGSIALTSTPNQGTTFAVTLPFRACRPCATGSTS